MKMQNSETKTRQELRQAIGVHANTEECQSHPTVVAHRAGVTLRACLQMAAWQRLR